MESLLCLFLFLNVAPTVNCLQWSPAEDRNLKEFADLKPPQWANLPSCLQSALWTERAFSTELMLAKKILDFLHQNDYRQSTSEHLTHAMSLALTIYEERTYNNDSRVSYHPLGVYRLTRRIFRVTNKMLRLIQFAAEMTGVIMAHEVKQLSNRILKENGCWLRRNDHITAIRNFLRVLRVYKVSLTDLTNGILLDHSFWPALRVSEMLEIVEETHRHHMFEDAANWATFLLENHKAAVVKKEKFLHKVLSLNLLQTKNVEEAKLEMKKAGYSKEETEAVISRFQPKSINDLSNNTTNENKEFERLCSPTTQQGQSPDQFCKWLRPLNGWYAFKMSVFSRNPFICHIENVISTMEMESVRDEAESRMYGYSERFHRTEKFKTRFLFDKDFRMNSRMRQFQRQLNLMTGFKAEIGETTPLLVTSEPLGGGYMPNILQELDDDADEEEIMAIIAVHVSNDYKGERIAFPKAGVFVDGTEGGLTLWFNLRRNGELHLNRVHSLCPIPYGHGWTAYYQVPSLDHFKRRPCALHKSL